MPGMTEKPGQVIVTDKARCRDCYRCLRACPVKAIQMRAGQASVVAARCIACGTCVRECPQQAKHIRDDLEHAMRLLREESPVAVSIAPSFAAAWDEWAWARLPSALRRLGFHHVAETAIGAFDVARATAAHVDSHPQGRHVCTACPAVVNYVELYRPELVGHLVPIVSPMIAHARRIKQRLGEDARVVFIGPCVAKKSEAERTEYAGLVDCVLTFAELNAWFARAGVDLASCETSEFDEAPAGDARYFPVPGGLARTAGMHTDLLDAHCRAASGFPAVAASLDGIEAGAAGLILEPLLCEQGCVNGPGMPRFANCFTHRDRLVDFAAHRPGGPAVEPDLQALVGVYGARKVEGDLAITEDAIRATLERTGKAALEDQLNCGACGYHSCRDKAVAVLRGLAEPEMCMPHMRRLAERRTDRIIETSPNGIIILDRELRIVGMNPAFRRLFVCTDAVLGKPISYLMDAEPFEKLAAGQVDTIQATLRFPSYSLICHHIAYALRAEQQLVGIFVDVTSSLDNRRKLDDLRDSTQAQARELLDHQIHMAQQVAQLIGEGTARGEALVKTLMELAGQQADERSGDCSGNTFTTK
jgi:iron only hydrogenase large subunit-like protein/uncharacterized Fe-S cluster-containing protein